MYKYVHAETCLLGQFSSWSIHVIRIRMIRSSLKDEKGKLGLGKMYQVLLPHPTPTTNLCQVDDRAHQRGLSVMVGGELSHSTRKLRHLHLTLVGTLETREHHLNEDG